MLIQDQTPTEMNIERIPLFFVPLNYHHPINANGMKPLLVHSPLESFKLVDKPKPNVGWLKQSSTQ